MDADRERIRQILEDLQPMADKWKLELTHRQRADGTVEILLGAIFTPREADPTAQPSGDLPATGG